VAQGKGILVARQTGCGGWGGQQQWRRGRRARMVATLPAGLWGAAHGASPRQQACWERTAHCARLVRAAAVTAPCSMPLPCASDRNWQQTLATGTHTRTHTHTPPPPPHGPSPPTHPHTSAHRKDLPAGTGGAPLRGPPAAPHTGTPRWPPAATEGQAQHPARSSARSAAAAAGSNLLPRSC
jgi:hypothetical protein